MTADPSRDFESLCLEAGLRLHVQRSRRFKSVWVDLFLPRLLHPVDNTRLALVARLLERGTRRHPDLRALNRYTDRLYGAARSCQAVAVGAFQVLHLHYDALDAAFLPAPRSDLLPAGFELLGESLADPYLDGGAFPPARVAQEKEALRRSVEALYSDRTLLAQRRCLEIMCAGEPFCLPAHGDPDDLPAIDGSGLPAFLEEHRGTAPVDIYVCGDVEVAAAADLCRRHLAWPRRPPADLPEPPRHRGAGAPRRRRERGDVSQGRQVTGYRSRAALGGQHPGDYPAFALLNLLLGADVHSRLYRTVREEKGLCYHIASYTEPMGGMLFVEAGVEARDRAAVLDLVAQQLRALADGGPTDAELTRTRALAQQRLDAFDDARDSLVRFHYYRLLAGADTSRRGLRDALGRVRAEQVRAVAGDLELDTDYFLEPGAAAVEPAAADPARASAAWGAP